MEIPGYEQTALGHREAPAQQAQHTHVEQHAQQAHGEQQARGALPLADRVPGLRGALREGADSASSLSQLVGEGGHSGRGGTGDSAYGGRP